MDIGRSTLSGYESYKTAEAAKAAKNAEDAAQSSGSLPAAPPLSLTRGKELSGNGLQAFGSRRFGLKADGQLPQVPGFAHGGRVPGKAKVKGDSPKNDTVNAKLSPGEVVVPRSALKSAAKAKNYIQRFAEGGEVLSDEEAKKKAEADAKKKAEEAKKKKPDATEGNWLTRMLMGSPESKGVMADKEVWSGFTKERT